VNSVQDVLIRLQPAKWPSEGRNNEELDPIPGCVDIVRTREPHKTANVGRRLIEQLATMALPTLSRRRFTHSLQDVPKLEQKLNVEWLAYAVGARFFVRDVSCIRGRRLVYQRA
jgi:hypothetical protein